MEGCIGADGWRALRVPSFHLVDDSREKLVERIDAHQAETGELDVGDDEKRERKGCGESHHVNGAGCL